MERRFEGINEAGEDTNRRILGLDKELVHLRTKVNDNFSNHDDALEGLFANDGMLRHDHEVLRKYYDGVLAKINTDFRDINACIKSFDTKLDRLERCQIDAGFRD